MDQQEQMKPLFMEAVKYEKLLYLSSKDDIDDAQQIISSIDKDFETLFNPRVDLN